MTELSHQDLSGARFEDVDLSGSLFHNVDLTRAVIRGAVMTDARIDGLVDGLTVNGVDVSGYVEAELDRRHPERLLLRPTDAAGYRAAWDVLEGLWAQTMERASGLPEELLHESVDGEYSFIETLRHLVFATDAWVRRAVLGVVDAYDPLGLPHDEMPDDAAVPRDRTARPDLATVAALRADRMATVREVLQELTDERLAGQTEPVDAPGYPPPAAYAVKRCLSAILNEEWWHRRFAERDLDLLSTPTAKQSES